MRLENTTILTDNVWPLFCLMQYIEIDYNITATYNNITSADMHISKVGYPQTAQNQKQI